MLVKLLFLIFPIYFFFRFKEIKIRLIYLVLFYPLLIIVLLSMGLPMVGILELYRDFFSDKVINIAYWSYLGGLILFGCIFHNVKNCIVCDCYLVIPKQYRLLLFLLLVVSALPILNTHGSAGFKSATFYVVCNVLMLLSHQEKDGLWFFHLMLCLSLLIVGERVDSVIVIIALFIKQRIGIYPVKIGIKVYILGFLFFLFLVGIGFVRSDSDITIDKLMMSIGAQATACDVVQIYLSGISYYLEQGNNFNVLYCVFTGWLPGGGVSSEYCFTNVLREYMPNLGGGLFFTEGVVAFGVLGIPLYISLFACVLKTLIVNKSHLSKVIFLLFFVLACRFVWYGYLYIYKPLILLVMVYYIFNLKRYIVCPNECKKCNHSK